MKLRDRLRHLLDRLKPRRLEDPAFGSINFNSGGKGVWLSAASDHGYKLRVYAGRTGPTGEQRALWTEFETRRVELLAKIMQPLFEKYNSIRDSWRRHYEHADPDARDYFGRDFPELKTASEIWSIARLITVEIMGNGYPLDLCLLFEIDWGDPEHVLSVTIKDWTIVDIGSEG